MNRKVSKEKDEIAMARQRKQAFENIMANVKPMLMDGIGKNSHMVTALANVPIELCFVDPSYQGDRQHKKIKQLEANFDKRKLTPITLVPHYDEYRFAIVDGQGRFIVCPKMGMTHLYATILMDAPDNPEDRLRFEAEHFIGQDTEVENVKPLEKHLARVILNEPAAVALDNACKKYGVKYKATTGSRSESILGSYLYTYKIAKTHGEDCLNFIFSIIKNAGWDHEKNGYAVYTMKALETMYTEHPNDRKYIHKLLFEEFRQMDPALFSSVSRAKYQYRDTRVTCTLYTEDLVCEKLKLQKKVICNAHERLQLVR